MRGIKEWETYASSLTMWVEEVSKGFWKMLEPMLLKFTVFD